MPVDVEKLRDRRAKLEAELKELEAHEKEELERRAIVAGHAVLAHADRDPSFNEQLLEILKSHLKKKRDRSLFGLPAKRATPKARLDEASRSNENTS